MRTCISFDGGERTDRTAQRRRYSWGRWLNEAAVDECGSARPMDEVYDAWGDALVTCLVLLDVGVLPTFSIVSRSRGVTVTTHCVDGVCVSGSVKAAGCESRCC